MKTIALSMIFSLAVIVCEQQTLFAPHFVTFDGLRAANRNRSCLVCTELCDCKPGNSLVPIAGANRLVPGGIAKTGWDVGPVGSSALSPGDCSSALVPTAPVNGVSMYDDIRGGQEGEDIVDSYQLLPWHRG